MEHQCATCGRLFETAEILFTIICPECEAKLPKEEEKEIEA